MRNFITLIVSLLIFIAALGSVYSVAQDLQYNTYTRKIRKPIYPDGYTAESYNDSDIDKLEPIGYEEVEIEIDPRNMELSELETAMKEDYENLKAINPECKGWFNIANVGYYPIMQAKDNDYYLHYNEYNEWFDAGAPFLDKNCKGLDGVALIYGHHFISGRMFGAFEKYKQHDFFFGNDDIVVYDGNVFRYYKPFTVYLFGSTKEEVKKEFSSKEEKEDYLRKQAERSLIKADVESFDFDALFFQTCDYTFYNARLVIGFRLIEEKKV